MLHCVCQTGGGGRTDAHQPDQGDSEQLLSSDSLSQTHSVVRHRRFVSFYVVRKLISTEVAHFLGKIIFYSIYTPTKYVLIKHSQYLSRTI